MSFNGVTSISIEELLEKFENSLATALSLIYQNKLDEIIEVTSELLEQAKNLAKKIPHIDNQDWFKSIIKGLDLFHCSEVENPKHRLALQDTLFENAKHLERFRRDERNKNKNSRIVFEEIFSTVVKTYEVESHFETLTKLASKLAEKHTGQEADIARIVSRIEAIAKDCECHSFLSISLSWEVIWSSIDELQMLCDRSEEVFQLKFPELEQCILSLDLCFYEMYSLINLELEACYGLQVGKFEYRRRYLENSIFLNQPDLVDS